MKMYLKLLSVLLVGLGIGIGVPVLAQNSPGGAFLTNYDYILDTPNGWLWRTRTPFRIEGATDDAFETTITFDEPTADTTLTFPDGGGASAALLLSALTTNDVDVVNSVWGVSNGLRFEGATADAFETTVSPTNVGADITLTLPGLGDASGAVLASSLTTNDLGAANSVWGVSNGLTFEGATADAGELFLTVANIATASRTMTLPDMAAASAVLASTLTTNTVGAANSVWGVSNGLTFEGASADAGELFLTVADIATASRTMTLPDMGAASAILASTLTTNTVGAANSVWGVSAGLIFEGSDADTEELTFTTEDLTADVTVRFKNDLADTYEILTMPDGDVTGGVFIMPPFGIAATDNDMTMADNTMYVYRVYVPQWITVANIYGRGTQGAQIAGTDDLLGVAIYEDADAGTQLATSTSADFTATADVTFNPTDVTLGPGMYRIGVCSGDGDGIAFVAGDPIDDEAIDVYNLGAVVIGTAANACSAAVPAATTGALTTADILMPVLKFGA